MTHILITGPCGAGKSTLIRRILKELERPVFGFETQKEEGLTDPVQGTPLYFYPVGEPRRQTEENLLGYCGNRNVTTRPGSFDRFAPLLLRPLPEGTIMMFDELGFMESREKQFCAAILDRLDGDTLVIAAVKDRAVPFLDRVRHHPRCRCFPVTAENRDVRYREVLRFAWEQMGVWKDSAQPVLC